jgi:hypothetical protein
MNISYERGDGNVSRRTAAKIRVQRIFAAANCSPLLPIHGPAPRQAPPLDTLLRPALLGLI